MKIVKSIMTKSPCYTCGRTITVKGLYLHSVGCPQPKASVFINQENKASAGAGVAGFIQADGTVYQTLPINFSKNTAARNWHCGSGPNGSHNNTHIGIEMCEPSTIKYTGGASWKDLDSKATKKFVLATYATAVEYFAYLCNGFELDPLKDGVILSHSEGCKRGYATNHSDVEHIWSKFGLTMKQFRKDVAAAMKSSSKETVKEDQKVVESTKVVDTTAKTTDVNYTVTINSKINVFASASNKSSVVTSVKKGEVYTIIQESNGFGKLKSGAGWVKLSKTTKCSSTAKSSSSTDSSFKVKVIASSGLNIRTTASTSGKKNGAVACGKVCTIVKTSNGFGKLKTGEGWISIDSKYVTRL